MPWQAPKPKAARRPDPKPEPAPREKTRFDEQREEIEKEREERAELIEIEMRDIPITIYCTDDNANCKEARAWFDENDYRFEEFDVKSDGRFQRERDRLNPSKSIPTIIVGETVFDKFDAKTIEGELRKLALEEVDS